MTFMDLKFALQYDREDEAKRVVKSFLKGADPVFQSNDLMRALEVLGAGEFTSIRGANGETVLHAIVTKNADKPREITILSAELIQTISRTADFKYYDLLTVTDNEGFTALQRASMKGYTDLLERMLGPLTKAERKKLG